MIDKIIDFLFSPPPAPAHAKPTAAPQTATVVYTKEVEPPAATPTESQRSLLFVTAVLPCMLLAAAATYFGGPSILKLDSSVVTSLTVSRWILAVCGSAIGIGLAWVITDAVAFANQLRRQKSVAGPNRWRKSLIWLLVLAVSALPLYQALQCSIVFTETTVRIGSPYSLWPHAYSYSDIDRVLAFNEESGDTFLSPGTFYFSIEFNNGTVWDSRNHPEGPWSTNVSRVLRFLSRKTGKYIDVGAPR